VDQEYRIVPIGVVRSPLTDPAQAPRQGDEGAPPARLEIDPAVLRAVADLRAGDDLLVLTWLHRARRDVLATRPRDDPDRAECGVFSTRSPDRPNPVGLHRVRIVAVDATRIKVEGLEAVDGTPVVDLKPVLGPVDER